VNLAWTPRNGRTGADAVKVVATSGGQKIFEGVMKDGGITFPAAPGAVQLDLTVLDQSGEAIDREQRTMTVPDPAKATLALTTPIVSRARSTSEFRTLSAAASPTPYASREFLREDRLLVSVTPYGSGSADAEVTAQLLGPRGDTLRELPIHRAAAGNRYELDLPLRTLAVGEFLIALIARTPTDRVETLVPLRIGR
jgi:hypothetical protein